MLSKVSNQFKPLILDASEFIFGYSLATEIDN